MVTECIGALAVDFWLQTHMHQCGVLWHLLLFLFNYDYTLEEGGVERSDQTNQQVTALVSHLNCSRAALVVFFVECMHLHFANCSLKCQGNRAA